MVVHIDGDSYDLFMLNHDSAFSWLTNDPKSIISSATSTWSDKLTVDSSYDVVVKDTFVLNFSETKARLLLKSEYDNLPAASKEALKNYCNTTKNIVKEWGNSLCGLLDIEGKTVGQINPGGYVPTYNFDGMWSGASLGSNSTARPVVHITMNDDLGNKDLVTKTVTDDYVIIKCDDKEEKYTINRIKILSTGQLRTRYGIILFLISTITVLLVIAKKKRTILKSMID